RHLVDRALRIAKDQRTVTCLIFPSDLQVEDAVEKPPHAHDTIHSGIGYPLSRIVPAGSELDKAARIINEGKKVAILVGAGAKHAVEEVKELAARTGAGVAKALLGRTVLSDHLPYVTGAIGLLGTKPTYDMMMDCDTFLMIGSSFPYPEFLPKEGSARGIQIDIDGRMLSIRYPMELVLKGDSRATLQELLPLVQYKEDRTWRETIEDNVSDWWKTLEKRAMVKANPVNPQRVFWELSSRLPDDAIISADSGSVANWFARDLKMKETMLASLSGTLASMGPGVPYAIAAKFNYPHRTAIALVGDGAMQMSGNKSLITIGKYWKTWENPRLVVMVLNNRDLNLVTWEQRILEGDPKFEASQNIPDFPYASYAQSLGLVGIRVEDPEQLGEAWDRVLNADRPAVLEVVTDPEVPPIPPHITFSQAVNYAKSLISDPNRGKMIIQTIREKISDIF
ncbi:MAG: thiamine pyrophosphate-requiring protein, partial [Bacteroidetes bacterium]